MPGKDQLEEELAEPELYQDGAAWSEVNKNYDDCIRRLDRWMNRWEEAQLKIDQVDQQESGESN